MDSRFRICGRFVCNEDVVEIFIIEDDDVEFWVNLYFKISFFLFEYF